MRCSALLALLVCVPPLAAVGPPPPSISRPKLPRMVDARVNLKASYQRATEARAAAAAAGLAEARRLAPAMGTALNRLEGTIPGLEVKLSDMTGGVSVVQNAHGALTPAAPGRSSAEIALGFVRDHGNLYGLSGADVADLVVLGDSPGGASGLRMVRLEQQIDGRPIFQSETRFLIDRDGRLMKSVGLLVPNARRFAPNVQSAQLLPPGVAMSRLLAADGRTADPDAFTVSGQAGAWLELASADAFVAGPIHAREVLFPLAPGLLVPAWSLVVFTSGDEDWYAIVDAQTGDLLWRKNIRNYVSAHDARFRVYVQADGITPADSPAPQSPSPAVSGAGTQFAEILPTIVSMHTAMDATASPNGWIDDCPGGVCTANETQTLGNNVLACLDREAPANTCDTGVNSVLDGNGRPMGNPDANARNRDFLGTAPRDFQTNFLPPPQGGAGGAETGQTATGNGAAQTIFRRGSVTQQFYSANWYHDQLFALGFDEAAGNFQVTNFSGMGLGGDRVLLDVQDNAGTNNANFSTPPDGVSGRSQMFRFTGPTIDRDGGIDNEILFHELTHGTSNRLVGDAAGLNWDPAAGMGEGWSDFYALSLLNNTNADDPDLQYAAAAYATYKFLFPSISPAYVDNYVYGIRRFPYDTDNTVNPMTWADLSDVSYDLSGGIPPDPLDNSFAGGAEVHNAGEIWALTLWEVRSRIIDDPAGANGSVPTGNQTMLQLVTDGLKMTPIDPNYLDARDAIIDADCATNACANETSIWGGFADRGLGYRAKFPYFVAIAWVSSHQGVEESFSSPYLDVVNPATDVAIDDSASNNNGDIDPGEAVALTITLTNPWQGAGKAVASATATLTTSTPGVTIFDNTATYGAIAPQGTAAGDTFTLTVDPSVLCGSAIDFTLTTVSSLGTTAATFRLRVGGASGTDPVVTYTGNPSPDLAIQDFTPQGVFHQINVTDDFEIADIDFRVDSLNHTFVNDLNVMLQGPNGLGIDTVGLIGQASVDGGSGDNLINTLVDDDQPFDVAHDMTAASAAANSPGYDGPWVPEYNSASWPAIVGLPGDPTGNLTPFDGLSTKGTWSALAADEFSGDTGTLNAWSILVTPVHFACTAFAAAANVTATKTVSGTFTVGGTVTYTVTLTNNGTAVQGDNTGDEFTDTLPASLTLVNAVATSGTPGTAGNTVTWNGSLAPLGGSVTITITATINAGTQGTSISNQGTVSYDSDNNGTNDATNLTDDPGVGGAADPTVFAVSSAAVNATKTVSGTFAEGGTITYTIILSNSGSSASPDNAGNELTDVLPASLTLVNAVATSGTPGMAGNTVTWNGSVPASGSVTITITATINAGAGCTTITNQASFAFDADLNGTNESTGTSDDPGVGGANDPTVFTVQCADLTATKTVSGTFTVGGVVNYTIVITNNGNATATGVTFTDDLPASLTLGPNPPTSTIAPQPTNTDPVTWTGNIPAGGSVTITIQATINAGTGCTTISNQGSFTFDADLNGSNESAGTTDDPSVGGANDPTVFTVQCVNLSATKTVSGNFNPGGTVTYTIVITNNGNATATGVVFTDDLPASLTLGPNPPTSTIAPPPTNTDPVTWTGNIPAGGSVTITIQATISQSASGTISNQGSVAFDSDLNGTNETTILTDDPGDEGSADPTTFVVAAAPAIEVPTLSQLGLLLLGLALLFAAWSVMRRRSSAV